MSHGVEHRLEASDAVIWHELECGAYTADLPLWRELAAEHGDPVLEIGAGAGRVALELARQGHDVTALDHDELLAAELSRRAAGLRLEVVVADAHEFELRRRFALIVVPMQTIQLLRGRPGRVAFLGCARRHLREDGALVVAISPALEPFDGARGDLLPIPDMVERDGVVYFSQPTAVRRDGDAHVLERRRERVAHDGERTHTTEAVRIEALNAAQLQAEASEAGLRALGSREIPPTGDHVGSVMVMLRG